MTAPPLHVAFFGHDAVESTIVKRVRGLAQQGCLVTGFMFRRHRKDVGPSPGGPGIDLGTTRDRSYLGRLPVLAVGVLRAWRARATLRQADVLYARNLDMLVVAFAARLCCGARGRVAYEVLDIQRPMLRSDLAGRALRWVERRLMSHCTLLVVSSPAFMARYFVPVQRFGSDWLLLENKVAAGSPVPAAASASRPPGPPWVIGWFGTLRCRRSFRILCQLADDLGEAVEIRLAGRPSPTDISTRELEAEVSRRANMTYLGAYENPRDLPMLYGPVHFAWCADYIDAGANSDWLLPNRIYEGGLNGVVALGRRDTETGRVIEERGLGLGLAEPIEANVRALLERLTPAEYGVLQDRLSRNPRHRFVDEHDTATLVARLRQTAGRPRRATLGASLDTKARSARDPVSVSAMTDAVATIDAKTAVDAGQPFGRITRIAVIIPYFQRDAGILARALRSVAGQRFDWPVDLDVIVVDDASPCSPEPELEGLPPTLSVRIIKRPNGGPGAARNSGLDAVSPEVGAIAFLDSDDIWRPDHLAAALRGLGTDCDFYFCDHLRPDGVSSHFKRVGQEAGDLLRIAEGRRPASPGGTEAGAVADDDAECFIAGGAAMKAFVQQYWAHTSCVVYRRAQMPDLRFDATLRSAGEDYLFTLHLICKARQICFSRRIRVERGFGVNLYDRATDWNHPNNLGLVFDNFRCFLRAADTLTGDHVPIGMIKTRLRSLRFQFIYVFIRKIIVMKTFENSIFYKACLEDRSFILQLLPVAIAIGAKKALGIRVEELA